MATRSNSEPESRGTVLSSSLWPAARAGEALYAAAREAGSLTHSEVPTVPESLSEGLSLRIEQPPRGPGSRRRLLRLPSAAIRTLAARAAPLFFRVGTQGGFLAIVRGGRRTCTVIDPI
jgi:hypothetical protein